MIVHKKDEPIQAVETLILPHNIPEIPSSALEGKVDYHQGDTHFEFESVDLTTKRIKVSFPALRKEAEFEFKRKATDEILALFNPLTEDSSRWFVTEKIPYIVNGVLKLDDKVHKFEDQTGLMDWGRGIWTYQTQWIWANAIGWKEGNRVGINLGSLQRSSISLASEDVIFYNEKVLKLGTLKVDLDLSDVLKPWKIKSVNSEPKHGYGVADIAFIPEVAHPVKTNLFVAKVEIVNVYGVFKVVAKFEGKEYEFEVRGFAEAANHRW